MQKSKFKILHSTFNILHYKKGFTLVEALVAVAVLLVGVIGVIQLFPAGLKSSKLSKNETIATNLAQAQMEQNKALSYDEVVNVDRAKISDDPNDPYYKFEKQISVNYVNSDLTESVEDTSLKKIIVTIFWQEDGQEKNISLTFIKHK